MNPAAAPHPAELSTAQVRALLDTGGAVPLLPDHLPAPVRIETQWWHLPLTSAEPDASSHEASRREARYVVAPPEHAAAYDRLAARLAAAAAAATAAATRPPPRCGPAPGAPVP